MSKKIHAQRNEKLCVTLKGEGVYHDWSITTAFYSSLHYLQFEIFPFNDGKRVYPTFDNYYNSLVGKKNSRHKTTIDLVYSELPDAGDNYKWLHDTCRTARYHNYNMPDAVSTLAIQRLEEIKDLLIK